MPTKHAFLSASSAHRWLHCPPSAKLASAYPDQASSYALEGTDAHELCEYKLKTALGIQARDPRENLSFYNEEMEACAEDYANFVLEQVARAKETTSDSMVLIEQRVDFSHWVPDGFGTADAVIIADGVLSIIDYKHGQGVLVEADHNPQMMCYALGAYEMFAASFTVNFLTKEKKVNEGEIPQYYVKNNHEAIIDPEIWDEVQRQIELRKSYGRKNRTKLFSCKIRCGNCGGFYGAVTWHAGSKYQKNYWQCLNKYDGKKLGCKTPHVSDEQLKTIVVNAINRVLENKNEIISHFREVSDTLFDVNKARADLTKAQGELQVTEACLKDLIESNARISQDQDAYEMRYQQLVATYETQEREAKKAEQQLVELEHKRYQVDAFLKRLEQQDHLLTEFNPTLFYALVDTSPSTQKTTSE